MPKQRKNPTPVYHSFQEYAAAQRNTGVPSDAGTRTDNSQRSDPTITSNVRYFNRYLTLGDERRQA